MCAKLRRSEPEFPGTLVYFLPADIVSQTLNFGLPAPFDVQLSGAIMTGQPRHRRATGQKKSKKFPARWTCGSTSRTTGRNSASRWIARRRPTSA
jgi:hypothetical protein